MIKLSYFVNLDQRQDELNWLKENKIYPSVGELWHRDLSKWVIVFGMVVSPDMAVVIKLRRNIYDLKEYNGR